jgi:hypothetical protein
VTAGGVIPSPEERKNRGAIVTEVGRVACMDGRYLTVAVNGSAVLIDGRALDGARRETFAQMFVRACWMAGLDAPREVT